MALAAFVFFKVMSPHPHGGPKEIAIAFEVIVGGLLFVAISAEEFGELAEKLKTIGHVFEHHAKGIKDRLLDVLFLFLKFAVVLIVLWASVFLLVVFDKHFKKEDGDKHVTMTAIR
ncbi:MAG: hypothetical protein U0905_13635 [Pirellulales bacterium]